MLRAMMRKFADYRLVRMSNGHLALVRHLGLVKGGRGLKLHEKIFSFDRPVSARNRDEVPDHAFDAAEAAPSISGS
jgi:hypothetical protein